MLNLKVRLKQKWFWITLIPLLFLFADQFVELFALIQSIVNEGGQLYESEVMALALSLIGLAFSILALVGFPVDLTTDGYGDSVKALSREIPGKNASETAMLYEGVSLPIKIEQVVSDEEYAEIVARSEEQAIEAGKE